MYSLPGLVLIPPVITYFIVSEHVVRGVIRVGDIGIIYHHTCTYMNTMVPYRAIIINHNFISTIN